MCQSKSQGGRRCAAHNNAREHGRAKRDLKAAVQHRDSLIAARDAGNARVSDADIAAAEHQVLVKADLALLMDPKLTDEQLEQMWENASPEVQAAARPVAQSIIQHGRSAAKLSGEASTARMFDRTHEAERFDEQAEEERSKAARLVDALRAALTDARTAVSEGVQDTVSGDGSTVGGGVFGAIRDFAAETGQALRDGLDETAAAVGDGLTETVEAMAAGVGIAAPAETGHGGDGPEHDDEHDGESSGEDTDQHVAAAEHMDGDSGEDIAADESDDDDSSDDDQSAPSTIASPRQAHAQAPAWSKVGDTPTAEAVDGDSASAGRGPALVKGRKESQDASHGASQGNASTPSSGATARRTPAPGIGIGNGATPKPQPQPARQVEAEPAAGVMGTPQKEPSFDVTKLSDSELLSFISRLYAKLRG
ncbi:Uncharacterised protein [Mycobacteroides abscessus subsp. massiliense]|uniref:hypothetical protein n=1 Tax=Mycobacteroides abscessus TaxID=36809 RepID=UPI0009A79CD3|nr:hypothetical protein [Mycobacteroides abscessus]MDO3055621.1 hypothetical protein [Mycobacteroides abscessus subsp. massiliense]SLC37854.1 Uncharacterised protein [Mycobacteroides abscessus subsp. massiliense]SLH30644.1 Uncharacterised protein [Mycobacteroides abscessus subsp. massiliense]SLI03433.1 Uncharacterised protein [Mycobacteroides abscessus subsp. massiliense]